MKVRLQRAVLFQSALSTVMDPEDNDGSTSSARVSTPRKTATALIRFFSFESDKSDKVYNIEWNPAPDFRYGVFSREFLLKFVQLLLGAICAGLYSEGLKATGNSITSLMFPNVVFSAFIIITSVIMMSYVLGHNMPPVLVRIFNAIGMILYFVATCVTGEAWYRCGRHLGVEGGGGFYANMLLAQIVVSSVNVVVYGYDMFVSVRRAVKEAEMV